MDNKPNIKLYSLALAGVITITSLGVNSNNLYKSYINKKYNDFKKFVRIRIVNTKLTDCYNVNNITIFIDNNTLRMNEYIYYEDESINKLFELNSKDLIYYNDLTNNIEYGKREYQELLENSTVVSFNELDKYMDEYSIKQWYSLDDIKEIENYLLETLAKDKTIVKVLKK